MVSDHTLSVNPTMNRLLDHGQEDDFADDVNMNMNTNYNLIAGGSVNYQVLMAVN